jgi:hypothetical protein
MLREKRKVKFANKSSYFNSFKIKFIKDYIDPQEEKILE